jgi:hypothetical protein
MSYVTRHQEMKTGRLKLLLAVYAAMAATVGFAEDGNGAYRNTSATPAISRSNVTEQASNMAGSNLPSVGARAAEEQRNREIVRSVTAFSPRIAGKRQD